MKMRLKNVKVEQEEPVKVSPGRFSIDPTKFVNPFSETINEDMKQDDDKENKKKKRKKKKKKDKQNEDEVEQGKNVKIEQEEPVKVSKYKYKNYKYFSETINEDMKLPILTSNDKTETLPAPSIVPTLSPPEKETKIREIIHTVGGRQLLSNAVRFLHIQFQKGETDHPLKQRR